MLGLKSQAPGSKQLKCRRWKSNTFTVGDYSLSISPATRAMDIALERCSIRVTLQLQIDFSESVFLPHFMDNKIIKSCLQTM